jgi:hypothetical protein
MSMMSSDGSFDDFDRSFSLISRDISTLEDPVRCIDVCGVSTHSGYINGISECRGKKWVWPFIIGKGNERIVIRTSTNTATHVQEKIYRNQTGVLASILSLDTNTSFSHWIWECPSRDGLELTEKEPQVTCLNNKIAHCLTASNGDSIVDPFIDHKIRSIKMKTR